MVKLLSRTSASTCIAQLHLQDLLWRRAAALANSASALCSVSHQMLHTAGLLLTWRIMASS